MNGNETLGSWSMIVEITMYQMVKNVRPSEGRIADKH